MSDHGGLTRCRAWLRRKLGRVHSSDQTGVLPDSNYLPPPYDNQQTPPLYSARPLIIALPREEITRIRTFANLITSGLDQQLAPHLTNLDARNAVVAIIREGCIAVATTVCQVALQTSLSAVNDLVDNGQRKAAEAVTTVARTVPETFRISLSYIAAQRLTSSINNFVIKTGKFLVQYTASAQLLHVVHGVAAVISFRSANNYMSLDQIDLLPREQFELHTNSELSSYVGGNSTGLMMALS